MADREIDLLAEMMQASQTAGEHLKQLQSIGIGAETIASLGAYAPIGLARIEPLSDLQYQPSDDGDLHITLPIYEGGGVIDIIAFNSKMPDRWYRRIGQAALLNADEITTPTWDAGAIEVWATPLDWLRAGGAGVVILDYDDRDIVRQLSLCETIVTDRMTARLIRLEFSRPRPVPRIINREHRRYVA